MRHKLLHAVLLAPLVLALAGCAPRELFSGIDRNCYVADWTNHHSCLSCCCCKHGSCERPPQSPLPMLQLGEVTSTENDLGEDDFGENDFGENDSH